MNSCLKYFSTCLLATAALLGGASPAWAQTAPDLGTAANFAALGGTGVTCTSPDPAFTGITVSGGDVGSGSTESTTVTGFPGFTPGALPCSLSGAVLLGQTAAIGDLATAYSTLAGITCDAAHTLSGDISKGGTEVLKPGVYCISGVGLLEGQLTLNGGANGIWIFHAASSITAIGGSVVMAGGGESCNVYWQTGTLVSLDNTDFVGNVLAGSAITFTGVGSSLVGRALALRESVTLTGANITACEVSKGKGKGKDKDKCNQGVGNGDENCDPGNSNQDDHGSNPFAGSDRTNDELGGTPGHPGRLGN